MKIKVTHKYRPFSHESGTPLLIPGSVWKVTVYPAKLAFESLETSWEKETYLLFPHIFGPVASFTVLQDLEKGWVRVFGLGKGGYFSYRITALSHHIALFVERAPEEGLSFTFRESVKHLKRKETLQIPTRGGDSSRLSLEKMHFGCSKKQNWCLVKHRLDLREILPIWFALGKGLPSYPMVDVGSSRYLKKCFNLVAEKNRVEIGPSLIETFKVGFEGLLSPRLFDDDYQSYALGERIPKTASPLALLSEGAKLIRSLLIDIEEERVALLPCLPKDIHAGRFINIDCGKHLVIDLEWSKKCIRRLILHSKEDQTRLFFFQKCLNSFRLRKGRFGKGDIVQVGTPLVLQKDRLYILDRFQK